LASLEHPNNINGGFASWLRYCTDVAQRRSIKLCKMFGRLLGWYTVYTFWGLLLPQWNFTRCKIDFASKSCVFSYIGRVTARHSSSERSLNFAAWYKGTSAEEVSYIRQGNHLCASAHILVIVALQCLHLKRAHKANSITLSGRSQ